MQDLDQKTAPQEPMSAANGQVRAASARAGAGHAHAELTLMIAVRLALGKLTDDDLRTAMVAAGTSYFTEQLSQALRAFVQDFDIKAGAEVLLKDKTEFIQERMMLLGRTRTAPGPDPKT